MRRSWHSPKRWGPSLPAAPALAGCTGDGGRGAAQRALQRPPAPRSATSSTTGAPGLLSSCRRWSRARVLRDFIPTSSLSSASTRSAPTAPPSGSPHFTRDSGPNRERIRVHNQGRACDDDDDDGDNDPNGYFYAPAGSPHNQNLSPSAVYRVRVFVQERIHPRTRNGWGRACRHGEDNTAPLREVGFADVDVVRNQREARCVDRAEFVPPDQRPRRRHQVSHPPVRWMPTATASTTGATTAAHAQPRPARHQTATARATPASARRHLRRERRPPRRAAPQPRQQDPTRAAPDGTACPLANAAGRLRVGRAAWRPATPGFANCDGERHQRLRAVHHHRRQLRRPAATPVGSAPTPTCARRAPAAFTCESGWPTPTDQRQRIASSTSPRTPTGGAR